MKTDYDYYLLGCRDRGVEPLSRWRFSVAYAKYQRERGRADVAARQTTRAAREEVSKKRRRIVGQWAWLESVAALVRHGQDLHDRAKRYGGEDDLGAAGSGVREPLPPFEPVLVGCAARTLPGGDVPPNADTLDEPAWWQL